MEQSFGNIEKQLKIEGLINAGHIIKLCKQIEQEEQRIKMLTVSDNYAAFRECEIRLGYLYNELMGLSERHNIKNIENEMININLTIKSN